MPIYEYACQKCGEEFEVQQRITEDPLTAHESCGGEVKRLISLTAFSLKGDGWYSDHYGLKGNGDGKSEKKGSDKGESTPSEKSGATTKEKTEAKKDSAGSTASATAKTEKPTPNSGKAA